MGLVGQGGGKIVCFGKVIGEVEEFETVALPGFNELEITQAEGVMPAAKVTAEIAGIRGVPEGVKCVSPPYHSAFSTPEELLVFVDDLRRLSGGKPTGFKLCIGRPRDFVR